MTHAVIINCDAGTRISYADMKKIFCLGTDLVAIGEMFDGVATVSMGNFGFKWSGSIIGLSVKTDMRYITFGLVDNEIQFCENGFNLPHDVIFYIDKQGDVLIENMSDEDRVLMELMERPYEY